MSMGPWSAALQIVTASVKLNPYVIARPVAEIEAGDFSVRAPVNRTRRPGNLPLIGGPRRLYLAPHSITSSARMSSVGGTVMPSALAVLRLITSSNLVGPCTGSSAGFSP